MSTTPKKPLKVLVVGLGQMGRSHALACHCSHAFEIVGLVNRSPVDLPPELDAYPRPASFEDGLALRPDLVSINTYTDSHAALAIAALEAGAHVFVEKPLALTLDDARAVVETARRTRRKLVVGYILRHHPAWAALIAAARTLGPPYVMRMNLNQCSSGAAWEIHKRLLQTTSPVVDCGIHYVDVMCQIAGCRPVQVRGMGARLADDIAAGQVNYAHLQVLFEDGSVGWYEAGWGPMMSPVACFVKDVVGARGSASLLVGADADSAQLESHTEARRLRVNRLSFDTTGRATATEVHRVHRRRSRPPGAVRARAGLRRARDRRGPRSRRPSRRRLALAGHRAGGRPRHARAPRGRPLTSSCTHSNSRTSPSPSAAPRCSPASSCAWHRASSSSWSAPRAAASRRCCASSRGSRSTARATCASAA